jgi:hypothetical protein
MGDDGVFKANWRVHAGRKRWRESGNKNLFLSSASHHCAQFITIFSSSIHGYYYKEGVSRGEEKFE